MEEIADKIERLEEEIRNTPHHKGTEHHLAVLKAKLAKLYREKEIGSSGGSGVGYGVRKSGDATCVLVGPPSCGKSTLLNALTGTNSKIGAYDFTTLEVIPGMMEYKGAKIQLFDVPGLIEGAAEGKGKGKKILSVIRTADLLVILTDLERVQWFQKVKNELYQAGIRLNSCCPQVKIKKLTKGGIKVIDPYNCFTKETVVSVAREFNFNNGEVVVSRPDITVDQLIDIFSGNRVYLPAIEVVNKIDECLEEVNFFAISAKKKIGLESLKREIWRKLNLMRIYLREQKNKAADFQKPLILKNESTVEEAATKTFLDNVSGAFIWGKGVSFPGQFVTLKYSLQDEQEVFFEKKRER